MSIVILSKVESYFI